MGARFGKGADSSSVAQTPTVWDSSLAQTPTATAGAGQQPGTDPTATAGAGSSGGSAILGHVVNVTAGSRSRAGAGAGATTRHQCDKWYATPYSTAVCWNISPRFFFMRWCESPLRCVLKYKYRTILRMVFTLMNLCALMGRMWWECHHMYATCALRYFSVSVHTSFVWGSFTSQVYSSINIS